MLSILSPPTATRCTALQRSILTSAFGLERLGRRKAKLLSTPKEQFSNVYDSKEFLRDASDIEVEVRTLDELVVTENLLPPDFIKADVQGMELDVLRGAEGVLESVELLLLESSFRRMYTNAPLADEVISFLSKQQFRIYDIVSYSVALAESTGELVQADVLFARDGSPLFTTYAG